jgi:hypothetical protein
MSAEDQFVAALTNPALPVPQGLVSPRGTTDQRRFAVYRNNVHVSLVGALAARFPVTRLVVGEDFFTGMARLYVGLHKPLSPVMLHYGDGFPAFIADFPPADGLPFLPDLARLELAWSEAYHAAEGAVLSPAELARIAPETLGCLVLVPAPSTRLVTSAYPVGSIWSAHQRTPFTPPEASGAEHILLTRPGAEVRLTLLPPTAARFLDTILAGADLTEASEAVLATHPHFDPGSALVGLAGLGAFAALQQEPHHAQ